MTDKVQKIREEVERLMYGFNLEADIASCEDAETEKLANIKYQLCKKILDHIDKVQEEPVSEDLNTAAKEYANNITKKIGYRLQLRRAVCFGANWQKEKMMKEAIEGIARPDDSEIWCNLSSFNLKDGDKVRVVVIKED